MNRITRTVALLSAILFTQGALAADMTLAGQWLAENINGGGVIDRLQTTLEIGKDGAASGKGGCNRYSSKAVIEGASISFGGIASTRMMCPPASMDQERKFFAALENSAEWQIDQQKRKLTLLDKDGKPLVVFARMD